MATSVVETSPHATNVLGAEDPNRMQQENAPQEPAEKAPEGPKPKIFDNKNFVEAPLPKTNPWKKPAAPAPRPPPATAVKVSAPPRNPAPQNAPRKPTGKWNLLHFSSF